MGLQVDVLLCTQFHPARHNRRAVGPGTIDISAADLEVVKGRCANEGLEVLGLRFRSDKFVPGARFRFQFV